MAEFLRLDDHRGRDHCARDQPVTHSRIEIAGARAKTVEMQRRAFAGGYDKGRVTGALYFGEFDLAFTSSAWAT